MKGANCSMSTSSLPSSLTLYSLYDCDLTRSNASMQLRYETLNRHKLNHMLQLILQHDYPEQIQALDLNLAHDDLVNLVERQELDYLHLKLRRLFPNLANNQDLNIEDVQEIEADY